MSVSEINEQAVEAEIKSCLAQAGRILGRVSADSKAAGDEQRPDWRAFAFAAASLYVTSGMPKQMDDRAPEMFKLALEHFRAVEEGLAGRLN